MRARIVLILIALTCLWTLVIGRAAYLQLWPNSRLKSMQKRQFETVVTLNPRRGDVLDRNGHELAVSMTTYSLFADPKIIEQPKAVTKSLAKILKLQPAQISDKLKNRKKRFVWIQRKIDKDSHDKIVEMKVRGLGFIEESERVYPNDRLLSQTLGFVGGDGQGLEGLELKYNSELQAERKKVSVARDARGRPLIVNGQVFTQAPDGADIQLTIDREMQFMLEQELAGVVREHEADAAVGLILDAQTSEILAMGSAPTFDSNRAQEFSPDRRRARAVTDAFEPGSTMKTFLIAGALSQGILEPNSKINTEGGQLKIGKRTINEADAKHRFDSLTVSEILAYSSNVGAAKIGMKMGDKKLDETLRSFGFGERTGIDFPGEARGITQPLPWHEHLLANVAFGHGIAVTALQVANAYAVIANGGFLRQPYLVKAVRDHESGEVVDSKPKTIRRVLSDQVVSKMRVMLAGVTADGGTGVNARVPGFPVAGKTGTAQKVNPNGRGYLKGGYVSSFAGFLPANDPRFVIYVAVDHPRKNYYGGSVAAPAFSRLAQFAVRRAGLAPVLITADNLVPQGTIRGDFDGIDEDPKRVGAAASVKKAAAAVAVIPPVAATDPQPMGAIVPDLAGLTLREVMSRVSGTNVTVKVQGQGFVTHTVPTIGSKLNANSELTVFLSHDR